MAEGLKTIRVLFLEDNPDDVELELYELHKGGFDVIPAVSRNEQEFLEQLAAFAADIIIADYSLPDFTGIDAIRVCRQQQITAPVMLVSGMGSEQLAVDSLREGAIDYICKKNITSLSVRVTKALAIGADRQAMAAMEAEKSRLQKQLLHAQKMESVGMLAGGIAHDFNNLLTGIIGYASLSRNAPGVDASLTANLDKILTLSSKAANLVKSLLLFSRKIPLQFRPVDINSLISQNTEFIRRVVEEAIVIKLDLEEGLPILQADEGQLTQVLINFTVNARDAMAGHGTLAFKTRRCRMPGQMVGQSLVAAGDCICISISDTGYGIKKENIPRIFDPFFTTKEVGKGTGLGLAIVYSIINGHQGWIEVQSEEGRGTNFDIYLPVLETAPLTAHAAAGQTGQFEENLGHRAQGDKTILVVEDEAILRSLTVTLLHKLGYATLTARDGAEALEIYHLNRQRISLIFSDLVMPKKSGLELFTEIKKCDPKTRFILTSGYSLDDVQGRIFGEVDAILTKPYTPSQLAALLRKTLDA